MKAHTLALAVSMLAGVTGTAFAASTQNLVDGVALHGFDPVAYFVQKKATKGDPALTSTYDGATYEFSSAENKKAFDANPEKYLPQYGGFCAFATSQGAKADIDPHAYTIRDGKLYVNFSEAKNKVFSDKFSQLNRDAARNWPTVQQQDKIWR